MIVFTIFRLNSNRPRHDNVDDLKIKKRLGIEMEVFGMCWKEGVGRGGGWGREVQFPTSGF